MEEEYALSYNITVHKFNFSDLPDLDLDPLYDDEDEDNYDAIELKEIQINNTMKETQETGSRTVKKRKPSAPIQKSVPVNSNNSINAVSIDKPPVPGQTQKNKASQKDSVKDKKLDKLTKKLYKVIQKEAKAKLQAEGSKELKEDLKRVIKKSTDARLPKKGVNSLKFALKEVKKKIKNQDKKVSEIQKKVRKKNSKLNGKGIE